MQIATKGLVDGLKVGLLGGSFNPAHAGHLEISLAALHRLGLDQVWWLVTPGNPLKDPDDYADYDRRIAHARDIGDHPQLHVSDIERRAGLVFTIDTIAYLKQHFSDTAFVWLMGADSLAGFHRWRDWQEIAKSLPMAILNRPGYGIKAMASPAARSLARMRVPESMATSLADQPHGWVFLPQTANNQSATAIRAKSPDW